MLAKQFSSSVTDIDNILLFGLNIIIVRRSSRFADSCLQPLFPLWLILSFQIHNQPQMAPLKGCSSWYYSYDRILVSGCKSIQDLVYIRYRERAFSKFRSLHCFERQTEVCSRCLEGYKRHFTMEKMYLVDATFQGRRSSLTVVSP